VTAARASQAGLVLALGGGGARGLAHIGVLRALAERDIPVRAVAGTSIGAEIGAFFVSGMPIAELVALATAFDWKQTLQLFMPDLPAGGLVSGKRIMQFLRERLGTRRIEELTLGYAAVGTDLETGEQVVLKEGSLVDAVRASISLPGLLAPHRIGERWLVDGGVLNPVPFDVARELFGGPVVAVAVHSGARPFTRRPPSQRPARAREWLARARQLLEQPWMKRATPLKAWLESQLETTAQAARRAKPAWTARRVLDQVLDIMQAEIVRLRAASHPPDLMLVPAVEHIGPLEFYRGKEAIAAGYHAAQEKIAALERLASRRAGG
jgi:NTE family protein